MIQPTITAHSGCEGMTDGSLESIVTGIRLGVDFVEVDVRDVPGPGLVLSHDAVDHPSGLVTLRSAFEEIRKHPRAGINCDLKTYGLAQKVLALAQDCGLSQSQLAFSGSLRPSDLRENPAIAQGTAVYLNIEEALAELYRARHPGSVPADSGPWDIVRGPAAGQLELWLDPLIEWGLSLSIRAFNLPARIFEPWIGRFGERGVPSSVWTIDDAQSMRRLIAHPYVINLTTRKARLALDIRQEVRGKDQCS